jgi:hypothetical protein
MDNEGWNWNLLATWVPDHIKVKIVALLLPSNSAGEDVHVCKENVIGCFSIAKMYHALCDFDVHTIDPVWHQIWRLNVPERVRAFVWMVKHDRLLTNESIKWGWVRTCVISAATVLKQRFMSCVIVSLFEIFGLAWWMCLCSIIFSLVILTIGLLLTWVAKEERVPMMIGVVRGRWRVIWCGRGGTRKNMRTTSSGQSSKQR